MNTSSSTARLRPFRPQPFGRYTLLSHLATGGMGEIYLARLEGAQGFEKLCVIKKILPQLAEDKEFVDRFVGEARTLVKLHHGSIAQVLDMGLHEGDAYMALEYVDGKDLRKVAGRVRDRQMPLPLTFVLFVMGRVLDALAYAHRKRDDEEKEIHLVHRDISPQNILISYEGEVKVIDFGLAKSRLSAAKTNPSIILGKFLYMSPEQAKHQQVDRRSDLYAVGLCLYELIAGTNPFDSVASGELMSAVASPRIVPLIEMEPFTPPPVAQMVMKALAVDPAQRFQTAEEFRGRLMSVLMEIDASAGPESVSRFMRDLFAAEFQSERKLLAQLKDAQRIGDLPPKQDLDTDPGARFPPPALPPKTIKLDPPSQPLSFQPTPRSRQGVSVHEEETRPGVMVSEAARPPASFEALDAAARARVRPTMSSTSPTTDTVTMEIPAELPDRPPSPPVATAAPPSSRASAPTVEVPVPYVPSAAIPPSPSALSPSPGTARTLEAPRAAVPPPPPVSAPPPKPLESPRAAMPAPPPVSSPSLKPLEPPRAPMPAPPPVSSPSLKPLEPPRAPVPAPPPVSSPSLKSLESLRAGVPPPPPSGASAPRPGEVQRVGPPPPPLPKTAPPPPPVSAPVQEPRSAEVARSQAPTIQSPAVFGGSETSPSMATLPFKVPPPSPVAREVPPPPSAEDTLPPRSAPEPPEPSREPPRAAAPRGSLAEPNSSRPTEPLLALTPEDMTASQDASRRGLDDTHPSYQLASGRPPEDTQPRVVLDDSALKGELESEEQVIVSGVLEESTPARAKAARRGRVSTTGTPTVPRSPPSGRFTARQADPENSASEDSLSLPIDVDDGAGEPRDPREDTRKTPLPTRPGESSRRAQREDSRRSSSPAPAPASAPARKRSWPWLVVSVLLVAVAGAAVFKTLPQLKHMLKIGEEENAKPPPAIPIRPVPVPAGPPGSAPVALHPPPPGTPPGAPEAAPSGAVPGAGTAAKSGQATATTPESASPDDELFVPLPTAPSTPPKKGASSRPSKKTPRSKESQELQKDWNQTRSYYAKITQEQACETTKIAIFCSRYSELKQEVTALGDEYSKDIHNQVKKLRKEFQQRLP